MAAGAVLAAAPDLDMLPGLLLDGNASTFHRAWWSHSPAVGAFGFAATLVGYAVRRRVTGHAFEQREALRYSSFVALALLTHVVADYVLVSPALLLPQPGLETEALSVMRWIGAALLRLGVEVAFYAAISVAALWLVRRIRERRAEA